MSMKKTLGETRVARLLEIARATGAEGRIVPLRWGDVT